MTKSIVTSVKNELPPPILWYGVSFAVQRRETSTTPRSRQFLTRNSFNIIARLSFSAWVSSTSGLEIIMKK